MERNGHNNRINRNNNQNMNSNNQTPSPSYCPNINTNNSININGNNANNDHPHSSAGGSNGNNNNGIMSDNLSRKRRHISASMPSQSPPAVWEQRRWTRIQTHSEQSQMQQQDSPPIRRPRLRENQLHPHPHQHPHAAIHHQQQQQQHYQQSQQQQQQRSPWELLHQTPPPAQPHQAPPPPPPLMVNMNQVPVSLPLRQRPTQPHQAHITQQRPASISLESLDHHGPHGPHPHAHAYPHPAGAASSIHITPITAAAAHHMHSTAQMTQLSTAPQQARRTFPAQRRFARFHWPPGGHPDHPHRYALPHQEFSIPEFSMNFPSMFPLSPQAWRTFPAQRRFARFHWPPGAHPHQALGGFMEFFVYFLAMFPFLPYWQNELSSPDSNETENYEAFLRLVERSRDARPRGLARTEIDQLPSYTFNPETHTGDQTSCVVCMCDFEVRQILRMFPCLHEFHAECVDTWLRSNRTCPICRGNASDYFEAHEQH